MTNTNVSLVLNAKIQNNGSILKPNPYLEVIVDSRKPIKLPVVRNTNNPQWNEYLTISVKIQSIILFKLYDYNSFRKNVFLAEKQLSVKDVLMYCDGNIDNLEGTLTLQNIDSRSSKLIDLVIVIEQFQIDSAALSSILPVNNREIAARKFEQNRILFRRVPTNGENGATLNHSYQNMHICNENSANGLNWYVIIEKKTTSKPFTKLF